MKHSDGIPEAIRSSKLVAQILVQNSKYKEQNTKQATEHSCFIQSNLNCFVSS